MTDRNKTKRAFTLIELLVVVAIIAVVASMLAPMLNKSREKAKSTHCVSNIRQMMMAHRMYAGSNDGYYTPHYNTVDNWASTSSLNWAKSLLEYGDYNMYLCPSNKQSGWNPIDDPAVDRGNNWCYLRTYHTNSTSGLHQDKIPSPGSKVAMWEPGHRQDCAQSQNWSDGNDFPKNWNDWRVPHDSQTTYNMPFWDGHVENMTYTYANANNALLAGP